ncbi:nucleoside phosphatase GDA1/CD39 [Radiomyces spectabilis]|uniref:nucleoside phosphatase GDA1/CD39 n=1 Tax=Radiomyces spectabilis TaxID=64574 RepID=UPI0022211544|nr:nucleoside phosphatase GDA1/CD39 [Radiomyces spectabilis]KAI8376375.1 nucleoside phosphatase GDA1/CD39 [Radiomyces spectabilis]
MMNATKNRKSLLVKCALAGAAILLLLWILMANDRYTPLKSSLTDNNDKVTVEKEQTETATAASEHCATPFPGRPLVQYAIMIDAGSSGSRVHVYRFNYCKEEPELEDEVFKMLEPGLSSYADDPQAAAGSLDPLMKLAVESVPIHLQHCTPIAVKATAGLRLLGKSKSDKILQAVRHRLETEYPFPIAGPNGVEIMDGKDEGVYAWITVNYLLGRLKPSQRGNSAAIFDLGGASTQIVFEPTFESPDATMEEGDHKYRLEYGHRQYELYQHSYLNYGLNEARKHIKKAMITRWKDEGLPTDRVYHPCLPNNHTESVEWMDGNRTVSVELVGTGAGHTECRAVIERVFNKEKPCTLKPCAFDGIYQPPLVDTFKDQDLYIFSYFYDLTQPLGMPAEFSVKDLGTVAQRLCDGPADHFRHIPGAIATLADTPDYCLDLTYAYSLLRIGYEMPVERLVRTAKKINDAETGWCLGASIHMIDEVKVCKID